MVLEETMADKTLCVVADGHYERNTNGVFISSVYSYNFFSRYTQVFENVIVVGRGKEVQSLSQNNVLQSDGPHVSFHLVMDFQGIFPYFLNLSKLKKSLNQIFDRCDCAIIRLPSAIGFLAIALFKLTNKPFAIELVADARNVYPFPVNIFLAHRCRKFCLEANGVAYVTQKKLQNLYPSQSLKNGESDVFFSSNYSSIFLADEYLSKEKNYSKKMEFIFSHVSNIIDGNSKGQNEAISVVSNLVKKGYNISLVFIGKITPFVSKLIKIAEKKGIGDRVHFTGLIASPMELRSELLHSDLFLFPSKSEGLPRCIIEAMACGLVCIASNVGGIGDLLDSEFLFHPKDVQGMTREIMDLLENPPRMNEVSKANVFRARSYLNSTLAPIRRDFYRKLRNLVSQVS